MEKIKKQIEEGLELIDKCFETQTGQWALNEMDEETNQMLCDGLRKIREAVGL